MEKITDAVAMLLVVLFFVGAAGVGRKRAPDEPLRPNWVLLGIVAILGTVIVVVR